MGTSVTVNSNYAGTVAGEITGNAFKEADTLRLGLLTVLPDVDFQVSLRKIQYASGRVDYACGFAPAGSVTLSEVLLTPKKIKNELEICKEELKNIWSAATMGFSAHNDSLPTDVEQALLTEILADQAEATDSDIWSGDATNTGEFDGFIKQWTADATVIKGGTGETITSIAAPITETNVESELKKVLGTIPVELQGRDLKIVVSPNVYQAYSFYLISKGISVNADPSSKMMSFGEYSLIKVNGLPSNTICVFQTKNVFFVTGLMADHNEIRIKDMDESDLTGQIRFKQVYTAGVGYVSGDEIIYYDSTAAQV